MTITQDDLLEFIRLVRWLTGRKLTQTDAGIELAALHEKYDPDPAAQPEQPERMDRNRRLRDDPMTDPLTMTAEEEAALVQLMWECNLNGAARNPATRTLIRLLWRLESRALIGKATVH